MIIQGGSSLHEYFVTLRIKTDKEVEDFDEFSERVATAFQCTGCVDFIKEQGIKWVSRVSCEHTCTFKASGASEVEARCRLATVAATDLVEVTSEKIPFSEETEYTATLKVLDRDPHKQKVVPRVQRSRLGEEVSSGQ